MPHRPAATSAVLVLATFIVATMSRSAPAQIFGANYNERPRDADAELFNASQTSWVRGFFDVFQMQNVSNLANDNNVKGMRRAADAGQQLLVSFKWNFDGHNESVPLPGSQQELALFDRAVETLEAIGRPVNTIVLGNEPMWETFNSDLVFTSGPNPYVPYVKFAERLRDHLDAEYGSTLATEPRYFVGALNRLDQSVNRNKDVVQELLRVARENSGIAGVDLHVHFNTENQARNMIAYGRQQLGPHKDLLVTEFSPVWRYKDHLNDTIGGSSSGLQFSLQYGYSPLLQVDEYLKNAFENQVSRQEWADFIISQPWFNENHIADMNSLFNEFDVSIGTLGFAHSLSLRGFDATQPGWNPYQINWLYTIGLVDEGPNLVDAYNEPYMEDWLTAQYDLADLTQDGSVDLHDYWQLVGNSSLDVSAASFTAALALGDLNLDRHIDGGDFARFASLHDAVNGIPLDMIAPADFDRSGEVDDGDWQTLITHLGSNLAGLGIDPNLWSSLGDTDQSGDVGRADFRFFKNAYLALHGQQRLALLLQSGNATVPEPATALLAAIPILAALTRRRRLSSHPVPARLQ